MHLTLEGPRTGRIIGAAALGSLAIQQSPANEAIRAAVGLWVLDRTSNPLAVGSAVMLTTAAIDGLTSVLIALGLHARTGTVRRIMAWARSRWGAKSTQRPTRIGELSTDAVLALGIGAGLVVARRHLRDARPTLSKDLAAAFLATLFVAVVAGGLGALAGGGLEHAERIGLGAPARLIVEYGSDLRLWILVMAAAALISLLRSRRSSGSSATKRSQPQPSDVVPSNDDHQIASPQ